MSVLINMEMPTLYRTYKVRFSESGDGKIIVGVANEDSTAYRPIGEVISVPPHGDLIERDVAYDKIAEQEGGNYVDMDLVGMGLNETPVIIPAEEATQKDEGQDEAPAGPYDLLYEEGGYNSNGV